MCDLKINRPIWNSQAQPGWKLGQSALSMNFSKFAGFSGSEFSFVLQQHKIQSKDWISLTFSMAQLNLRI